MDEIINNTDKKIENASVLGKSQEEASKDAHLAKLRDLPSAELAELAKKAGEKDSTLVTGRPDLKFNKAGSEAANIVPEELSPHTRPSLEALSTSINDAKLLAQLNDAEKLPQDKLNTFLNKLYDQSGKDKSNLN